MLVQSRRPNLQKAFTLMELVSVVAIVAVLSAILFAVIGRTLESARRSNCAANLRQHGLATQLYSGDYDDRLPHAPSDFYHRTGFDAFATMPPLSQILASYGISPQLSRCPSDKYLDLETASIARTHFERFGSSYFYFLELAEHPPTITAFPNPSRNLLLQDAFYFHGGTTPSEGLANVLFVDGRVRLERWSAIEEYVVFP